MEEPTRRIPYDELADLIDAVAGSQRDTAPIDVPTIDIPIDEQPLELVTPPHVLPYGSGIHTAENKQGDPITILLATLVIVTFCGIGIAVAFL